MPYTPAEKVGLLSLSVAVVLLWLQPPWAVWPLALYVLLCLGAPFLPRCGFFLPLISRGRHGVSAVALTFDDGPSPDSTPILLELLARYGLPATFFVIGEKAARHPELMSAILAHGHTVGNHSLRHDYFLMLRTPKTLRDDIRTSQQLIGRSGVIPLVFRPPVGITGPRLKKALHSENLLAVSYSCRAYDRGNRQVHHLADRILQRLQPGDIVMLHDLPPHHQELTSTWRHELERLFAELQQRHQVVPLAELIGSPVMTMSLR